MENGAFEDVFPIENGDFPWLWFFTGGYKASLNPGLPMKNLLGDSHQHMLLSTGSSSRPRDDDHLPETELQWRAADFPEFLTRWKWTGVSKEWCSHEAGWMVYGILVYIYMIYIDIYIYMYIFLVFVRSLDIKTWKNPLLTKTWEQLCWVLIIPRAEVASAWQETSMP